MHKALIASGLSEDDATTIAPGGTASAAGSTMQDSVLPPLGSPERIAAVLNSAAAEMQEHINQQSMSVDIEGSSRVGSTAGSRANTPGVESSLSNKDLAKFVRDFEAVPVPAEDMLWGLQGGVVQR
jgi:hypothetical protein